MASQVRGKGSKSGQFRRAQRTSDTEIDTLSKDAKAAAGLKQPGLTEAEKLVVVRYVTDPKRWEDFKIKQGDYFQTVCCVLAHRAFVRLSRGLINRTNFCLLALYNVQEGH